MTTPRKPYIQELRQLPKPIWILSIGIFLDRFGLFVMPFLVLFITSMGYSCEAAGFALASMGVGGFLSHVLGGYLSDRIGRRKTIAVAMIGGATCNLLLYVATVHSTDLGGLWATYVAAFAMGSVRGMTHSASGSLVADLVQPEERVAAFAVIRFAMNLGFALGMAIAGFVAGHSFLALFLADAVTSIAFGFIAVSFLPHGVRSPKSGCGWGTALRHVARNRAFQLACLYALLTAIVFVQYHSSFSLFLKESGYAVYWYGIILSLNGVLITIFEMPISALVRRFRPEPVLALGAILMGAGFGLNAWIPTALGLVLAMTVLSFGEMVAMPTQGAHVANLAPDDMRGRYNGILGMAWATSSIVGPMFGLYLLGISPGILCSVIAAIGILGAGIILLPAGKAVSQLTTEQEKDVTAPT